LTSTPWAIRRGAPKRPAIHQRLHFDQQRPPAVASHHDHAAGHRLRVAREENRRRVADLFEPVLAHREEAQLIDRAEAVLGRPQHAVATAGIALEIQHRIDQVLEQLRPGDAAVLGDVADEDDRAAAGLGVAHQRGRAVAQLQRRARARVGRGQLHGLDGVDHQQRRFALGRERKDGVERAVAHQQQLRAVEPEAPGAQTDLRHRFLAAGVDDDTFGSQRGRHLQQQR
jgi:hypothetical protein